MRARKKPNVMERGSVPCFSVFFRPNHESAPVALLQSRKDAKFAPRLVLYLRGVEILQGDWVALLPAAARQSVPQLSDEEKATRLDRVKTALGTSDPTVVVDALAADSNVLFIIEKRLCYDDV